MTDLRKAAEAVLERWDSPAWEWKKQGPTADLMANLRTALAAEQPKPEPVAWAYCPECGSLDVRHEKGSHKQCATCFQEWFSDIDYSDVVQQNLNRLYTAPPATHPGYVIGSHWLETAYSRICAGEAEADVLRDCGWERVDEALRRDAEQYRYLRDKAYVWDSDMPKAMRPVALWLHDVGNADIDAIINAAKENKR